MIISFYPIYYYLFILSILSSATLSVLLQAPVSFPLPRRFVHDGHPISGQIQEENQKELFIF